MARRCGHCYQRGHNRRSCPEIKRQIADNPDGYQARIARDKAAHAKNNPRVCGWCSESGHNKRTCQKLESDRHAKSKEIRDWRKKFLIKAKEVGFGIGTLIKFQDPTHIENSWTKEQAIENIRKLGSYGVVVQLLPKDLDSRQKDRAYRAMRVRFPNGTTQHFGLPVEFCDMMDSYAAPSLQIAAPIDSSMLQDLFDRYWHQGKDTVDWHLGLNK